MNEPCKLTMSLMIKLASIAIHVEELLSSDGHEFDEKAIEGLLADAEVKAWLASIPAVYLPLGDMTGFRQSKACQQNMYAASSQQADPPKEAEPCPGCGAKSVGDSDWQCGSWIGCNGFVEVPQCAEARAKNHFATVTNAAGGKQSVEPFGPEKGYPFVRIHVSAGPIAGMHVDIDIYDLIRAVGCKNVAHAQALKKLMRGGRDGKDWARDMREAADSIKRALEMES